MNPPDPPDLPRPFGPSMWPGDQRAAAEALWDWHRALLAPDAPALDGADLAAYFDAEQQKATRGEADVAVMPEPTARAAYAACEAHDLPLELLAAQVGAAQRFAGPMRFATAADMMEFVDRWAGAHALLLAQLAGAGHSWQERPIRELARGFFITARLARLPADLAADRLFIPLDDLEAAGVPLEQLRAGRVDANLDRLFWKQHVRVRDALAQGQVLVKELPRRYASKLKRCWLGALEVINEIERRDYDVWQKPPRLSAFRRVQIWLQAWLGRAASGGR